MAINPQFVHLRVHSRYSILESNMGFKQIAHACKQYGMPAAALADTGNLFGALEFSQTLVDEGIQPIHGLQVPISIRTHASNPNDPSTTVPLVLLAQNEQGYKKLLKLNSILYLEPEKLVPCLTLQELGELADGLICLTGGSEGPIGVLLRNNGYADALAFTRRLKDLFPDRVYQEIQRHDFGDSTCAKNERATEDQTIDIAYELGLPLVATNNVHFMSRDNYEAVDILYYIKNGGFKSQKDPGRLLTPEHCFKSQTEMAELFADVPEAIDNTLEIAQRCSYHAQTGEPMLPVFCDDEFAELSKRSHAGLEQRLEYIEPAVAREEYLQRLEYELGVIKQINFAGYFLIVADFVNKAKEIGVPVGPGRGSGAGSLVAYVLNITNLDPLRYSLLFERFLNTERLSVPDFDIDFCPNGRDKVIDYVREKYGAERVAQIVTFGSLGAKNAIRDFGRILRVPRHLLNSWASEIDPRRSFKDQRRHLPVLTEAEASNPQIKEMFDQIEQVEGIPRNTSRHAGGVVISNEPLEEIVPLYSDSNSKQDLPVTQFDLKWVEKAGLVKMDFLGLKTLTVIKKTVELLNHRGIEIDIDKIPLNDPETYELYASGQTVGVFQVEGQGMANTLKMMKPNKLEDIIALVALYRPGPMENIPLYCEVKNGKKKAQKLHKLIDHILDETNGIIVYQEQVMEIVKQMGGYSLGRADIVRRSMGKKIRADMEREKPIFIEGAISKGVKESTASRIWDLLAKFADYGFNKSHAAVYALVSYQTAYLKAHYPVEFMAAVMTEDQNDPVKISNYYRDAERSNYKVLQPDVNASGAEFGVEDGQIIYSLAAIKSVGADVARSIEEGRGNRLFDDILDFAGRINLQRMSRSAFENIARAGGFDSLDSNRKKIVENFGLIVAYSKAIHAENTDQPSLFGDTVTIPRPALKMVEDWNEIDRLNQESDALGFYLSDHPVKKYSQTLKKKDVVPIATIQEWKDNFNSDFGEKRQVKVAGIITKIAKRTSSSGKPMAILSLSDHTGEIEAFMFPGEYSDPKNTKIEDTTVIAHLEAKPYNHQLSISVYKTYPIETIVDVDPLEVRIYFEDPAVPKHVKSILDDHTHGLTDGQTAQIAFCPFSDTIKEDVRIQILDQYMMNQKVKQAIKGLRGVVEVKTV